MRRIVSLLLSFVIIFALTACSQPAASEKQKTEEQTNMEMELLESISAEREEADLAYYTNGRADQEQNDSSARPAISGGVENMERYDTIILGYPNMEQGFESVLCA